MTTPINVYQCENCRYNLVTRQEVEGTTPFITTCVVPGCRGAAQSSFGMVHQNLKPTHEWYKPDAKSHFKMDMATLDHVCRGGLLLRPIDKSWETWFAEDSHVPCDLCGKKEKVRIHKLANTNLCYKHRRVSPFTVEKFEVKSFGMDTPLGAFGFRFLVIQRNGGDCYAAFTTEEEMIQFLENWHKYLD
jgi:hypothetical protein